MGTMGVVLTPHMLSLPKNMRPQLTVVWVAITTVSIAVETCDHFEHPAVLQLAPEASSFIDRDLSCTMRMSGGWGMTVTLVWPQLGVPPVPRPTSPPPPVTPPEPLPPNPVRPEPPVPGPPVVPPVAPVDVDPPVPEPCAGGTGLKPQPISADSSADPTKTAWDRCMVYLLGMRRVLASSCWCPQRRISSY